MSDHLDLTEDPAVYLHYTTRYIIAVIVHKGRVRVACVLRGKIRR